jgi:hypothetical protein
MLNFLKIIHLTLYKTAIWRSVPKFRKFCYLLYIEVRTGQTQKWKEESKAMFTVLFTKTFNKKFIMHIAIKLPCPCVNQYF